MSSFSVLSRAAMRAGLSAALVSVCAPPALAQSIKVGGKQIDVHGSLQQGFNVTDENNFLTMDTKGGSGAMTDAAINVTSSLTPKLRVGAQAYVRNIGQLGNGHLEVDWAYGDFKFTQAIGVRGGKIKTVLGLYTDTQDMEFLYTWALLPQGTYPLDLRAVTIARVGGDVYGQARLGKAGSLAYTGYYGILQDDAQGGYRYGLQDSGINFRSGVESKGGGLDVRWTAPVNGLMAGYSFNQTRLDAKLVYKPVGSPVAVNFSSVTSPWRRQSVYGDYQVSRVHVSSEWRRDLQYSVVTPKIFNTSPIQSASWFAAASYRAHKRLEVGSYYSHYHYNTALAASLANNHIYDKVVSGRVDLTSFWHVKVEGHFIDGYGSTTFAHGFYRRDNPAGFKPTTNMLVLRTGVNF
jgi:hypothetical protein